MFRELTVYETSDGKRHDTVSAMQEHVADAARELIDARLEALKAEGRISANDAYRIVMAIIPDQTAACDLYGALRQLFDYG